jgi:hypothetical protein
MVRALVPLTADCRRHRRRRTQGQQPRSRARPYLQLCVCIRMRVTIKGSIIMTTGSDFPTIVHFGDPMISAATRTCAEASRPPAARNSSAMPSTCAGAAPRLTIDRAWKIDYRPASRHIRRRPTHLLLVARDRVVGDHFQHPPRRLGEELHARRHQAQAHLSTSQVAARWVSTPLAFAGQMQPRRLNV